MALTEESEMPGEKYAPEPFRPPQISNGPSLDRTQASTVISLKILKESVYTVQ